VDELTYNEQERERLTLKLEIILKKLPIFSIQYFTSIEYNKTFRTKVSYAIDITNFFEYIHETKNEYKDQDITSFDVDILDKITTAEIETYLSYLKNYNKNGKERGNKENSIKRKLSALRSFYRYYKLNEKISTNPSLRVSMPDIPFKSIIRLERNEMIQMLKNMESGAELKDMKLLRHNNLKSRNMALIMLMLGTGIRVSECVGLDINDVDFNNDCIHIIRKGGSEAKVYFGDEVKESLLEYLLDRNEKIPLVGHEQALFLSEQRRRLCVRSVEKIVLKYSRSVAPLKKITPHKLRSTYGTNLYQETKDIYLVADILGHKDVNTARDHYCAIIEENKKDVRNKVKLKS